MSLTQAKHSYVVLESYRVVYNWVSKNRKQSTEIIYFDQSQQKEKTRVANQKLKEISIELASRTQKTKTIKQVARAFGLTSDWLGRKGRVF